MGVQRITLGVWKEISEKRPDAVNVSNPVEFDNPETAQITMQCFLDACPLIEEQGDQQCWLLTSTETVRQQLSTQMMVWDPHGAKENGSYGILNRNKTISSCAAGVQFRHRTVCQPFTEHLCWCNKCNCIINLFITALRCLPWTTHIKSSLYLCDTKITPKMTEDKRERRIHVRCLLATRRLFSHEHIRSQVSIMNLILILTFR